jgi:hypothetical protein
MRLARTTYESVFRFESGEEMNQAGGALPNKSDFDNEKAGMMVGAVV